MIDNIEPNQTNNDQENIEETPPKTFDHIFQIVLSPLAPGETLTDSLQEINQNSKGVENENNINTDVEMEIQKKETEENENENDESFDEENDFHDTITKKKCSKLFPKNYRDLVNIVKNKFYCEWYESRYSLPSKDFCYFIISPNIIIFF